jgi:AraC-like DNA-binding protein
VNFKLLSYQPCRALQPYISCYSSVSGNHVDGWEQVLIPSNMQNLGFIFDGTMSSPLNVHSAVNRSFVVGQMEKPSTVRFGKDLEVITVFFTSTGMYRLFGIPMQSFTDRGIDFELVCDVKDRHAVRRIFESETMPQRLEAIEALLLGRLAGKPASYVERIDYASRLMLGRSGNMPVGDLAREVNMSKRSLERYFVEQVGVSPKSFSGISRIKKVLQLIATASHLTWKEMAQTLEYSDQAHFIHEFKRFTGKTPNEYFRSISAFEHFIYTV